VKKVAELICFMGAARIQCCVAKTIYLHVLIIFKPCFQEIKIKTTKKTLQTIHRAKV